MKNLNNFTVTFELQFSQPSPKSKRHNYQGIPGQHNDIHPPHILYKKLIQNL